MKDRLGKCDYCGKEVCECFTKNWNSIPDPIIGLEKENAKLKKQLKKANNDIQFWHSAYKQGLKVESRLKEQNEALLAEEKKPKYCPICGYEDNTCAMCSAPKKDFEPRKSLGKLAREKGFDLVMIRTMVYGKMGLGYKVYVKSERKGLRKTFKHKIYAEAEAKAIKYLEVLK